MNAYEDIEAAKKLCKTPWDGSKAHKQNKAAASKKLKNHAIDLDRFADLNPNSKTAKYIRWLVEDLWEIASL